MHDWTTIGALALVFVVLSDIGRRRFKKRSPHPFPPGPPGLPWIGNVIGLDIDAPWKTYAEWGKSYGDIIYSRLMGKDIIIINSEKIAKDLLEDRSKNYSDRPCLATSEMCGVGFNTVLLSYGERWRLHRRFFHQTYRLKAASRFVPYQHHRACHLLLRLLTTPEQLEDHLFEYTATVALNSAYDYDPTSGKDDLIDMAARLLHIAVPVLRPDIAVLAGAIPWLLKLPSRLPGMSFKRKMKTARAISQDYLERSFQYAIPKESGDTFASSMVNDALRHAEMEGTSPGEVWMTAIKEASGTAFLAASETSSSVLLAFFLMMVVNPAAQEKAQMQIDAVVGEDRLPSLDDRPFLPYVDAIVRETLRWCTVLPLSLPHAAVDDDVYDGFHIPKGTIILANVWAMAHDESRFPNAHAFVPERFLEDDGSLKPNEIEHIAFGFGRRICVGRHFADTTLWLAIVHVLAVFKLLKCLDEDGVEIPVEPKLSSGIAIHPLPFKHRIVPRYSGMNVEKLERLIADSAPCLSSSSYILNLGVRDEEDSAGPDADMESAR